MSSPPAALLQGKSKLRQLVLEVALEIKPSGQMAKKSGDKCILSLGSDYDSH